MAMINSLKTRKRFNMKRSIVIVLILAVAGSILLYTSNAATVAEPSQGLIIQVSSLAPTTTPAQLKVWLDHVRNNHRDYTKPGYINNVVLQDIADQNGNLLTSYLDVIVPYLPGGAKQAFSTAYLGTVDLPWTGTGSKYIEGITNADFRNKNVSMSVSSAKAFKARYPKASTHWYITYEANLAGFWQKPTEEAYVTYINQLMASLSAVTPGKTFLWSPAFWTPYRNQFTWALPDMKTNLNDMFNRISQPLVLDLQDFVGQSKNASTKEDAVVWINYIKQNITKQPSVLQLNTEQFTINSSGAIVAGTNTEVAARENYYAKNGIKLGPSWEIRYWHKRLYGY